jgi:hypothetical protein
LFWRPHYIGITDYILDHWWSIQPSVFFPSPEVKGGAGNSNLITMWLIPRQPASMWSYLRAPGHQSSH